MQRRKFMQQGLLAGGSLLSMSAAMGNEKTAPITPEDNQPFRCNYGFHDGMFKNNAGADFYRPDQMGPRYGFPFH
jgi:hydroxypyruvate isomerase